MGLMVLVLVVRWVYYVHEANLCVFVPPASIFSENHNFPATVFPTQVVRSWVFARNLNLGFDV